jgi:hypothetical protein
MELDVKASDNLSFYYVIIVSAETFYE